ncbi:phage tail sheath subtilisin-like domain-containing protein [Okeania sp. SIO2B3]|uniref:phage tail sheath family protein n=1 Tax=Okeania sp. SIO2B3 TaxID=2607784 RepID=UPI0013C2463C|nr:phage tail sheath subtilisin-like domain-containing protein [Okeania sp. SIO2B3]NET46328.1 phage tail sheath family protein [Okeania sp. SIO2B3]
MPTYLSPGVYVEEIASGSAPIVGVGTSIAAFIGTITIAESSYNINNVVGENVGTGDNATKSFDLSNYPVAENELNVQVDDNVNVPASDFVLVNDDNAQKSQIVFATAPASEDITVDYYINSVGKGEIKLCTNFSEFKNFFGDFVLPSGETPGQNTLAHAVYGFFRNGGTRCYVTWITTEESEVDGVLEDFEAIDEITIVVAPGNLVLGSYIKDHCEKMGDRIAILDSENTEETIDLSGTGVVDTLKPFNSTYAALYFPWIQVYDPASNSNIYVPPSGHIAGVYARVDGQRGVHKAPANETILGALELEYNLSKAKQDGLNPDGINCIRKLNGNIRVWGARTLGGDANGEFKYVNIRRQFNYLRDSIDKGTQWTVFEPNDSELWAKIRRNISAFLTNEWRNGALFGTTPQEAFYVKCDAETNPAEVRDLGQVITEIGVAVIKPAEFVIFRLSQWSGS